MHLHKRVCLHFHSLRLKISFGKCVRVVMLVTISVLISKNDNQSRMLSVTDGYKPQIILKPSFQLSALARCKIEESCWYFC